MCVCVCVLYTFINITQLIFLIINTFSFQTKKLDWKYYKY